VLPRRGSRFGCVVSFAPPKSFRREQNRAVPAFHSVLHDRILRDGAQVLMRAWVGSAPARRNLIRRCKTHEFCTSSRSDRTGKPACMEQSGAHNGRSLMSFRRQQTATLRQNYSDVKDQAHQGTCEVSTTGDRFQQRFSAALRERGDGRRERELGVARGDPTHCETR
jgi:hypothetical protein